MGEAAQQQARARFSAEHVVPLYEDVYERLFVSYRDGDFGLST